MKNKRSNRSFNIFRPKTLEGKMVMLLTSLVLAIVFTLITVARIQMVSVTNIVTVEENKQVRQVQLKYNESMSNLTEDTLLQLITWAADKTDDDFFVLKHDFYTLSAQVEDVFRHPENYARVPVNPPNPMYDGEYTLQILYPDTAETADPATIEKMERLANLAPLMKETVSGNNGYTLDCFIATPDGVTLAMDNHSGGKFDKNGQVISYDARTRPWFQGAVESGDIYFQPVSHSYFYNCNVFAFGIPVYVDGKLVAVVEGCTELDVMEKKLQARNVGVDGFSIIVSDTGQLVCTTKLFGELKVNGISISDDIRNNVNSSLKGVISRALSGEYGVDVVKVDKKRYYAAYAPLSTVKWTQIAFVLEDQILEPSRDMIEEMNNSEVKMLKSISSGLRKSAILRFVIMSSLVVVAFYLSISHTKRIVRPINRMKEALQGFGGTHMDFEMEEIYKTGDEIEDLALSVETMSNTMKEYVSEIVENTAEKQRLKTEMDAATKIQNQMLPKCIPDFYNKPGYDLYAKMVSARSVGGDLYDFFYLDEDHLVLTIGDVSGKGISAALFMALSKQTLKSEIEYNGGNLVEAMKHANSKLCEESADCMFVTVWMGILTLSTGLLKFVNAGHMYAAVKRGDNGFAIENDNHGIFLGAIPDLDYELNSITLQKGDVIYLYTDGITEAQDINDALFGEERLIKALDECVDQSAEQLDAHVRDKVNEFVNGMEQYDDMTTLCLRYLGI